MLRFLGTIETVQADDGCCLDVRGQLLPLLQTAQEARLS